MASYKEMYLTMFRGAEKARRTLLEGEPTLETAALAVKIIEAAQSECGEMYISADTEE